MTRPQTSEMDAVFRFLVAYRLLFYLGGLVAMSLPLGLVWLFDVHFPPAVRLTIVSVSFVVILATYLAERRVGTDHIDPRTGAPTEEYPVRLQVSVVLAIAGVAAGVYFVLVDRFLAGVLFLFGALLFFQLASRSDHTREGDQR